MTTKEIFSKAFCAGLIGHATSILSLPLTQIKMKYVDYPVCLLEYTEKGINEQFADIRFDREGVTLSCHFDKEGECVASYLFPDRDEIVEHIVSYLVENYNYGFLHGRFLLPDCFVKVNELKELPCSVCLMFFR